MEDNGFEEFKKEVNEGLSGRRKSLPSKYFYDDRGSQLFQQIMKLPEYYLTRCEHDIFELHKEALANHIRGTGKQFDLIELGAGDGTKTQILLKHFLSENLNFRYIPLDISAESNLRLFRRLKAMFPNLNIAPLDAEYFTGLEKLKHSSNNNKIVLFLGSNIGNFNTEEAIDFYKTLGSNLNKGDWVLSGFDLKKDPEKILAAYNDSQGVTREFNLNLLKRLNRELDSNFIVENFGHCPVYDPESGAAKSFLVSKKQQTVGIKALDLEFHFDAWEAIFTEISQKYDLRTVEEIADSSGYTVKENFTDEKNYFVDSLWHKNS